MIFGMKLYTVHIKPGLPNAYEHPLFVREGFNLWAFLFTTIWALYQRLWIPALLLIIAQAVIMEFHHANVINHASTVFVELGYHVVVGYLANDWLRSKYARKGYILADIAAGDSLLRAEQRYFERCLAPV